MLDALLIAALAVALLSCPLMAWLGRRGIGRGCAMSGCERDRDDQALDEVRARHDRLCERIAELEARERRSA